jgi:hypothetical protein
LKTLAALLGQVKALASGRGKIVIRYDVEEDKLVNTETEKNLLPDDLYLKWDGEKKKTHASTTVIEVSTKSKV